MAQKIYHLPLQQTNIFIKKYKDAISKLTQDKNFLEFNKLLGKAYYITELDEFINFFKISKDTKYALSTIEYFNSIKFIDIVNTHLSFEQFELEKYNINHKDFFYAFCNILRKYNIKLFRHLLEKLFLYYHKSFNNTTNINVDFKNISLDMAKQKNLKVKESFGEEGSGSYFKITVDDKIIIDEKGKLIKTLRKKAYKIFFDFVLDFESEENSLNIYDKLDELNDCVK